MSELAERDPFDARLADQAVQRLEAFDYRADRLRALAAYVVSRGH